MRADGRSSVHGCGRSRSRLGCSPQGGAFAAVYCTWATDAGFDVPHDIAVLSGGGGQDICESSMPTISSLDLDNEGRVRAACDLLERLMAGGGVG